MIVLIPVGRSVVNDDFASMMMRMKITFDLFLV